MSVQRLDIVNFRNIEGLSWELAPGLNVLEGENAQGKTNLLEAVYYLANGRSFRTLETESLIRFGNEAAVLQAYWNHEDLAYRLECRLLAQGRELRFQGKSIVRLTPVQAALRVLVFTPESSLLFRSPPVTRRRYFDHSIAVHRAGYASSLSRYQRVLRQRNQLLEQGGSAEFLASFDEAWAAAALAVMQERQAYLEELLPVWRERLAALSGNHWQLGAEWRGPLHSEGTPDLERVLRGLDATRVEERRYGKTLLGPQRDDLRVSLGGHPAREVASQGQQRLLVIALKLAEADIFQTRSARAPVFLLDDLGSELDSRHQQRLLEMLGGLHAQTVLTTAQQGAYAALQTRTLRVHQGRWTG